jgi:hypothetical protein
MDGLEGILGYIWTGCLAVACVAELIISRRPFVVAFAVPILLYLIALGYFALAFGGVDRLSAEIFLMMFAFAGTIGSLIGSGIGRGTRIWLAFFREQSKSQE